MRLSWYMHELATEQERRLRVCCILFDVTGRVLCCSAELPDTPALARRPRSAARGATTAGPVSLPATTAASAGPQAAAAPVPLEAAVCVTVRGATAAGEGGDPGLPWVRRLADCLAVGGDAPPLPVATDVAVVLQVLDFMQCGLLT